MILPQRGKRQSRSPLLNCVRWAFRCTPAPPNARHWRRRRVADAVPKADGPRTKIRSRLFRKYVALFVGVVCIALLANGLFEVFFYYGEHKSSLIRIQRSRPRRRPPRSGNSSRRSRTKSAGPRNCHGRWDDRAAAVRRAAAPAASAGRDRTGYRRGRQGATAGVAARHGRGRQRPRHVRGAEVH